MQHATQRERSFLRSTASGAVSWLAHPGDGFERRLQRIRDLWDEAGDAQDARLPSVLISSSTRSSQDTLTINSAGAANNYRMPIHLMNLLTGEIEACDHRPRYGG